MDGKKGDRQRRCGYKVIADCGEVGDGRRFGPKGRAMFLEEVGTSVRRRRSVESAVRDNATQTPAV